MIKKDLPVRRGNTALVAPIPHPLNDPIKESARMQVGLKRATVIPVAHAITVGARNQPGALAGSHWIPIHPHNAGEGTTVCFHVGRTIMGLSGNDIVGILVETRHSGIIPEHRDNPALSFF